MESKKVTILRVIHQMLWISTLAYSLECLFQREYTNMVWTEMLYILPLVTLSFAWYEFSGRLWVFLIAQPLILTAFVFAGKGHEFGYVVAFMVSVVLQILEKKNKTLAIMNPNWPMCVVMAVLYLLCAFSEREAALDIIPYSLMLYIVVVILFMNEVGLAEFMHMRQNVKNIQYGQVRKGNRIFILGVIGLTVILFIISSAFMNNSPIFWLMGKLRDAIRWLVNFLENIDWGDKEAVRERLDDFSDAVLDENGKPLDELPDGRDIPMVIYYVVGITLTVFLTILFIRGLVGLIRLLTERFKRTKEEELFSEEIYQDEIISIRPRARKKYGWQARTPEERVRRIYRKSILKARRIRGMDLPDVSFTPTELERESFGEGQRENYVKLHGIYEKARYSRDGVTEAEEHETRGSI